MNVAIKHIITFISTNRMMKNRPVSAYREEHTETKSRKICGMRETAEKGKAGKIPHWFL